MEKRLVFGRWTSGQFLTTRGVLEEQNWKLNSSFASHVEDISCKKGKEHERLD